MSLHGLSQDMLITAHYTQYNSMWYLIWRSGNWNWFPVSTCVSLQCSSDTSCNHGCGKSCGPKPATQCGGHPVWLPNITDYSV
jgi:hypothetical protein